MKYKKGSTVRMTGRCLALLLAGLLTITGAAGCGIGGKEDLSLGGSRQETQNDRVEQLLARGYYEVYDDIYRMNGYLEVTRRYLTRYDEKGVQLSEHSYQFDVTTGKYTVKDGDSFFVESTRRGLDVIADSGAVWSLRTTNYAAIKAAAADAKAQTETQVQTESETIPQTEPETETELPPETEAPSPKELKPEDIYTLAAPSTVDIIADVSDTTWSVGTGFFDDDHGTVITNYHVIQDARSAVIVTDDGSEYDVISVLGYDAEKDIAILSTALDESVPLTRRTTPVRTGEAVYALGNSLGMLSDTFSDGIVSSAMRDGYIQYTAAISHGNSGGPLLDAYGNVIGIVCAFIDGGQNLNLAIPISEVDTVSRTKNISLRTLFYGDESLTAEGDIPLYDAAEDEAAAEDAPAAVPETSWYTVCVAEWEDYSMNLELPEYLYDRMEINDEQTGTIYDYEDDMMCLYLDADILTTYGETISDDDLSGIIMDTFSATFDEFGLEADYVSKDAYVVQDVQWQVYTAFFDYDEDEGFGMDITAFVHVDQEYVSLIFCFAMGSDEATFAEADQTLKRILFSVTMEGK